MAKFIIAVSAIILAIAFPTNTGAGEAIATSKGEAFVDRSSQKTDMFVRMLRPYKQMESGQRYYNQGRFAEAVVILERAIGEERARGNIAGEAQGLNLISLAYQKLGKWAEAEKAIAASLSLLSAGEGSQEQLQLRAQTLNVRGHLLLAQAQAKPALEIWQEAEAIYRQIGDRTGILGSQINQAQALQNLGLYRRANTLFEEIEETLNAEPDSPVKAAGLHNFGNILRQRGEFDKSHRALEQSVSIAQQLANPQEVSAILLSLGNTERARGNIEAALDFYQEAAAIAPAAAMTQIQAQLNQLSLSLEQLQGEKAIAKPDRLLSNIRETLSNLPPSRAAVYAQVQLAKTIVCLERQNAKCLRQQEPKKSDLSAKALGTASVYEAISILDSAANRAEKLADNRAWSYALGTLGRLYEERGEVEIAKTHTQEALHLAQSIHAPDIAYQWQWQLGRLLLKQENLNGATAAYWEAVSTLQALRGDLVTLNRDRQFDFRDEVEPVYRKTVDLLLRSQKPTEENPTQEKLKRARLAIEALQLAELDNFFRDACLDAKPEQIDNIVEERDPTAAVLHAIILEDRLATILKLPGKNEPLRYSQTPVERERVQKTLADLRGYLGKGDKTPDVIRESKKLYRWLMEPIASLLANNDDLKTLVFVLDRPLQNVPMAVLHDGREYLLEKDYAIVLAPGLQLVDPNPLEETRARELKVFTGGVGLEQNIEGMRFDAILGVKPELYGIAEVVTAPEPLLDERFTPPNLERGLTSELFPVIHIKTHGQFSSDPERTFIVAYEELIKSRGLNELVKTGSDREEGAIELLVLSACSTAEGDDRAALGLAGIAVRAGARSILSTLWIADDEPTTILMKRFYQELSKPNVTRAVALHRAQLALFNGDGVQKGYKAPNVWATYVLVGNWL